MHEELAQLPVAPVTAGRVASSCRRVAPLEAP
jgi:hypothetical protein